MKTKINRKRKIRKQNLRIHEFRMFLDDLNVPWRYDTRDKRGRFYHPFNEFDFWRIMYYIIVLAVWFYLGFIVHKNFF